MGCCESFAKIILIILNILFFLIGGVILGVGIWLKVDKSNMFEMMRKVQLNNEAATISNSNASVLDILAIVLIVLGAFTFVSGFCGCCGAIKESSCLLYIYSALVAVVVIAEVAIGIYAGVEQNKFNKELTNGLTKLLKADFVDIILPETNFFSKIYTALMIELKCCGVSNISDFKDTTKDWRATIDNTKQVNPVGCCQYQKDFKYDPAKNVTTSDLKSQLLDNTCLTNGDSTKKNQDGCVPTIIGYLKNNLAIVIGVCIGLGLLEILCIVFACCIIRKE